MKITSKFIVFNEIHYKMLHKVLQNVSETFTEIQPRSYAGFSKPYLQQPIREGPITNIRKQYIS